MFIFCCVACRATFVVPFIGLRAADVVAVLTGLIISAEVAFILSVALPGKVVWRSVKAFFPARRTEIEHEGGDERASDTTGKSGISRCS
jgi:hypothetical protein